MAVAHTIVVITSHLLSNGTCYDASRPDRQDATQEARDKKRALAMLESVGSHVTVSPVTEVAAVYSLAV